MCTPASTPSVAALGLASLLVALSFVVATPCHAARPLSTDDAGVQAAGDCESDSYAGRAVARERPRSTAAVTQLGCGVVHRSSLAVAYARTLDATGVEQTLALVGKTALRE